MLQAGQQRVRPLHAGNEKMFDSTSVLYDPDGQWFERSIRSSYAYDITRRRLLELLSLSGQESVLEIGCGPGTWTRVIAEQALRVTAVDISREMLKKARDFVCQHDVTLVHSDILAFESAETYDRVVSLRAIEYVKDKKALVALLAGLVADGGELLIVSKTPLSVWRGRRLLGTLYHRAVHSLRPRRSLPAPRNDAEDFYQQRISPWHLARLLADAGFEDMMVYPVIVGLPIVAGVQGDVPLIPRPLAHAALRAFNRLGDRLVRAPQSVMRLALPLSESYALRARKRPAAP